jgi:ABC-type branched-subunit amino acid transport system substrate-binding protein
VFNSKWKNLLSIFFWAVLPLAASAENGVTPTEILLGQSAAFKGAAAGLGTELWRGAEAYFEKINAEGGVQGRQIRVLSLDDSYEGDTTLSNTVRLITQDKVFALFGYVGTPTLVKALPAIKEHESEGIFLFSDFTGAQPQREAPYDKLVFNVRASYRQETAAIVKNFVKLGVTKIGTFIQNDAYGNSGADGINRALKAKGLTIVAQTTYERNVPYETNMDQQVSALKAAGAQAVIAVGAYNQCAAFIRDARNSDWNVPIANLSFVGADQLLSKLVVEERASGKKMTSHLVNSQVIPSWYDTSNPLVQEYSAMMDLYDPKLPADLQDPNYKPAKYSFGSLEGYLNAKLFVAILKKVPAELTREAFVKAAESMRGLEIGTGTPLSFSPDNHQASNQVFFTTVQNGQWVPLKDWTEVR